VVIFSAWNKRYSAPDARFLLHPVSLTLNGVMNLELEKMEELVKGIKIDTDNIASTIARATMKDKNEFIKTISDRTTLSPQEAKDFWLVHEIKKELFPIGAEVISINVS
jgi:ATP-dependent protease ClpP protease subunit